MARQVRPTSRKLYATRVFETARVMRSGMCPIHRGPGATPPIMRSETWLQLIFPAFVPLFPLHARGGPCMLRGLGATPAAKRTGEQLVGLRSHQTFKNWMERYNVVDL